MANRKTTTEADVLNKILLRYAPGKIGAGGQGKTAHNDEWDFNILSLFEKLKRSGPLPLIHP